MGENIRGIEQVEVAMGRWDPNDLAIVERIELKNDPDHSGTTLVIESLFQRRAASWPDFDKEMFRVTIAFDDVTDLRLNSFGGGPVQIMGFDIHFVGDRGMEGINYEIEDYEDDRIAFSCSGVDVQAVTLAVD